MLLGQLRSFLCVARYGSFTRAAQSLHLSQPALTVRIRQLEESLGVRLLDRNKRAVHLTRTGRELAAVLQRLLDDLDAALVKAKKIATHHQGVVRLACFPSVATTLLPEAIASFRANHPGISFVVRDAALKRTVSMIRADEVDFGICDSLPNETDLESIDLMRDRMHVVYPATHPIARVKKVSVDELARFPLVLMDPDTSARSIVDSAFAASGRLALPACEATHISTAVSMVRAGLGIAILPSMGLELRIHAELRSRAVDDTRFARQIAIVKRAGRSLYPPSGAFIKELLARASA